MTPEEARQFLDNLAPGELEQLISECIFSQEDQDEFKKRLAIFLESELTNATTKLSTPAQAVLDAWDKVLDPMVTCLTRDPEREALAAAIRAAADVVVPEEAEAVGDQHDEARLDQWLRIRRKLLAIAAELEGQ